MRVAELVVEALLVEMHQVPQQTAHLLVGPVSQTSISVGPLNAEAAHDFTSMREEALELANQFGLQVVLSFEDMEDGRLKRFVFNPRSSPIQ